MDRENNKTNVGTDVHIRNINLQTTGAVLHMEMWTGQMGRLYISKCVLDKWDYPTYGNVD